MKRLEIQLRRGTEFNMRKILALASVELLAHSGPALDSVKKPWDA